MVPIFTHVPYCR